MSQININNLPVKRIHQKRNAVVKAPSGESYSQVSPLPTEVVALSTTAPNAGTGVTKAQPESQVQELTIRNGNEAVAQLGNPRLARKKATISRRLPKGDVEVIETSWGPQEAHAKIDYVAVQKDGSEYPYKKDLFHKNMEPAPGKPGQFRKKTLSKLLAVPEGTAVQCVTIDGGKQKPLRVEAPDFVCIGLDDEVYPMSRETFESDFEWAEKTKKSDQAAETQGWNLRYSPPIGVLTP